MAFNPGRNVGRVSIRVIPDTRGFNKDLRRELNDVGKSTTMKVRIDGAILDRSAFKDSMERQLAAMDGLDLQARVAVTIDKAKLSKTRLRKSIQEQFDQFEDIRVKIAAEIRNPKDFEKKVRDLANRASRNKVNLAVGATTAAAAAQLRYVSRPRFVEVFVNVNKASMAKALTTLSALSGARLTWQWIDDLISKMRDLDKNLPKILGWTTGLTSLTASIFAAGSGLVGLGEGLFSITPAFLVLPGLLLNAVGSVTALVVALKNSGTELAVLKDDMHELGDIINEEFWGRARQPIVDLVQGLMPQLRTAFADLSAGIGDFTAAMSQAFGKELANGRLASIFNGIAEGWRVLGTGAEGFAGALVSLSQIAATYTPRLAGWFVRQANTFDKWLKAIATDGRLESWMEGSIDSMYDLWRATTGVAGVLSGIWRAADAAGSTGLTGFADMMQEWQRVVNGADFQRGLTAVFRGSYVAMTAFGDAVRAIGRIFVDMAPTIERFIGSAGEFFFGIAEGFADALNSPAVQVGIEKLSTGLLAGLEGIGPSLQPIADTFGSFLGLLGELAGTLLPTAVGVIADLMPAFDGVITAVENVLPGLSTALSSVSDVLSPAIAGFVGAITPEFEAAMAAMGEGAVTLSQPLADFVTSAAPALAAALTAFTEAIGPLASYLSGVLDFGSLALDGFTGLNFLWDDKTLNEITAGIKERGGWLGDIWTWATEFDAKVGESMDGAKDKADSVGVESGRAFWEAFSQGSRPGFTMPSEWLEEVSAERMEGRGRVGGGGFSRGLSQGFGLGFTSLDGPLADLNARTLTAMQNAGLTSAHSFSNSLVFGIDTSRAAPAGAMGRTVDGIVATGNSRATALHSVGAALMGGLTGGLDAGRPHPVGAAGRAFSAIVAAGNGQATALHSVGAALMDGMRGGIESRLQSVKDSMAASVRAAVAAGKTAAEVRSPSRLTRRVIGRNLGLGVALGIDDTRNKVDASARRLVNPSAFSGRLKASVAATAGTFAASRGETNVQITQPLLPGETPEEQRDNLVRTLRYAF